MGEELFFDGQRRLGQRDDGGHVRVGRKIRHLVFLLNRLDRKLYILGDGGAVSGRAKGYGSSAMDGAVAQKARKAFLSGLE